MEIRKISDNEIAIDTPVITTVTHRLSALLDEKAKLEEDLEKVNNLISLIDGVKDEEVKLEKSSLVELVNAEPIKDVKVDILVK